MKHTVLDYETLIVFLLSMLLTTMITVLMEKGLLMMLLMVSWKLKHLIQSIQLRSLLKQLMVKSYHQNHVMSK